MITFVRLPNGRYQARLDALELEISDHAFGLVVHADRTHVPCEFTSCPVERDAQACRDINCCEFEYHEEVVESSLFRSGYASAEEVERSVKTLLAERHGSKTWPEPEASRFAQEPWHLPK